MRVAILAIDQADADGDGVGVLCEGGTGSGTGAPTGSAGTGSGAGTGSATGTSSGTAPNGLDSGDPFSGESIKIAPACGCSASAPTPLWWSLLLAPLALFRRRS